MKRLHLTIFLSLAFIMAAMAQPPLSLSVGSPTCSSSISLIGQFQNAGQTGAWRVDITPQYSSDGSSWTSLTLKSIYAGGTTSQSWTFNSYGFFYFRWQVAYYFNYGAGYTYWGGATYNNNQTSGVYYAASANFNINGVAVSATSPYEGYGYNCPLNALVLNNTAAGNMNSPQYQLYFQECNSTGGGLTGSVFGYNTWQSGWPSASYDMKTWPSAVMGASANVGKYYLITMKVKNGCNGSESVKQGLVHINSAPSAPGGVLRFNGGTAPLSNQASSHTIGSPNLGGCYSASFNLASTTGSMFIYKAVIDQVNCTTGAVIQNVVNPANYSLISGSLYTGLGINAVTSPSGYFGNNSCSVSLNNCYKLSVEFGNQCATATEWTYFKLDGTYKTDGTTGIESRSLGNASLMLYPNPANENVTLKIETDNADVLTVDICDLTGRLVERVTDGQLTVAGENEFHINLNDLTNGAYFFAVTNQNGNKATIKFIKN